MHFHHVAINAAKAGAHPGGLRGLVEYNARLCQDLLTQAVRYSERGDGSTDKQDFVDQGQAHLPDWARVRWTLQSGLNIEKLSPGASEKDFGVKGFPGESEK